MGRKGQPGEVVNFEEPDWVPLEGVLGDALVGWFMWMHEVRLRDGTAIHAYKHRSTRRYLHLDGHGGAFRFDDGTYVPMGLPRAIDAVFASWPRLGGTRADMELVDLAWDRAAAREAGTDTGTGAAA